MPGHVVVHNHLHLPPLFDSLNLLPPLFRIDYAGPYSHVISLAILHLHLNLSYTYSRHPHLKPVTDFINENTGEELDTCNNCRNNIQFFRGRIAGLEVLIQAGERLVQQQEESI